MKTISIDHTTFFQVSIIHLLLQRWKIEPKDFLKMDEKFNIISFLREGYDLFHLSGKMGTIEEVESYIHEQGGVI